MRKVKVVSGRILSVTQCLGGGFCVTCRLP